MLYFIYFKNFEPGTSDREKDNIEAKHRNMGTGGGPSTGDSSRFTDRSSSCKFPLIGGISVERLSSSQPLRCRNLTGQHSQSNRGGFNAVEFSDDGSLFASGGDDGVIKLWTSRNSKAPQ